MPVGTGQWVDVSNVFGVAGGTMLVMTGCIVMLTSVMTEVSGHHDTMVTPHPHHGHTPPILLPWSVSIVLRNALPETAVSLGIIHDNQLPMTHDT